MSDPKQPEAKAEAPRAAHSHVISKPFFRTLSSRVTFAAEAPPPTREPTRRPAKVAQQLALAHHLQNAIDGDERLDRTVVAARLGVTKARITQLMDLTLLAPDLQDLVLAMEAVDGVEPMSERALRKIAQVRDWGEQRRRWGDRRNG